mmetsp:Transcript_30374/g.78014  ORF Transcript_30374/g.78014 Transcript_30374/m.78014 type:complete len:149 (+) Transcript_30374:269-715(+)
MLGAGIGLTDVGTGKPGTISAKFKSGVFPEWQRDFFDRLTAHTAAACSSIGCSCGECGAPRLVAFPGKRQYLELLNIGRRGASKVKTVEFGVQHVLPEGWPLPSSTEVWVCPSTSGAAAMTNEARAAPFMALGLRLKGVTAATKPACW